MHHRRLLLVPVALAGTVVLLVGGCSSGSGSKSTSAAATAGTTPTTTASSTASTAPEAAGPQSVQLAAKGIAWSTTRLELTAGRTVTVTISNRDKVEHNFTFRAARANKDIEDGKTVKVSFTAPKAGTYKFFCEYHPARMTGTVVVG